MNSRAAVSLLVVPAATSPSTSSSRWLSSSGSGARTRLISRAATEGARTEWPAAGGRAAPPHSAPRGARARAQRLVPRGVLEEVTGGARLDGGQHVAVGVIGGEHQHAGRVAAAGKLGDGGHPLPPLHAQAPQDY